MIFFLRLCIICSTCETQTHQALIGAVSAIAVKTDLFSYRLCFELNILPAVSIERSFLRTEKRSEKGFLSSEAKRQHVREAIIYILLKLQPTSTVIVY